MLTNAERWCIYDLITSHLSYQFSDRYESGVTEATFGGITFTYRFAVENVNGFHTVHTSLQTKDWMANASIANRHQGHRVWFSGDIEQMDRDLFMVRVSGEPDTISSDFLEQIRKSDRIIYEIITNATPA